MKFEELVEIMNGKEDNAKFAMSIVLENVKKDFVVSCIKAKLSSVEEEIKAFEENDYIYYANQHYSVNWSKPNHIFEGKEAGWLWEATEEEKKIYQEAEDKCRQAERLLYLRNRLIDMVG